MRNLPGFVRFLPVAALFNGQAINVAGIARDAGVARTTVQGYLDILEDTLLVYRLPAYEARARVRERRLPKLYWVDPGVVRATKRQLGALSAEERGPLLESWVLTTLRAHAETQSLYEADRLLVAAPDASRGRLPPAAGGASCWPSRSRRRAAITPACWPACARSGNARTSPAGLLVYTGPRSFRSEDGIDVWPAQRFASAVARASSGRDRVLLGHPATTATSATAVVQRGSGTGSRTSCRADSQRARQGARAPGPARTGAGGASAARSSAPTV